jgi:hypothetical protein
MNGGPASAFEATETVPGASRPKAETVRRPARAMPRLPLSVAVLGVPGVVAVVRLLAAARRPFDLFGDEAILDSAVRHVGHQLVGPYSRFGFHQPGPAYYYLQAPFSWLPGASAAALFLGAFCINLGAALGCVLVIRRFLGEPAARWSAIVVGALLVCLTPALLANPWNPYVLALPVLLVMVLAAAATERASVAAVGGAAAVGSFVVQTHVAAAATLLAMAAAAGTVGFAVHVLQRRSPSADAPPLPLQAPAWAPGGRRPHRIVALAAAGALLMLLWAPPLAEQTMHSPGNLRTLARFFRTAHPAFDRRIDHSLSATTGQLAAGLTVVPFGHDRDAEPTDPEKVVVAGFGVLFAGVVAVVGLRRRRPFVAALGAMSFVGPLVAMWSGTRIVGEVFPYLLLWTCVLLLPGVIGAGALLLPPPDRRHAARGVGPRLVALAAAVLGLSLTWTMERHPLLPYPTVTDVGAAARLAEPYLADRRMHQVRIRIAEHERWPLAAGIAVRFEKDGLRATVDQEWTFLFGDHFRPTGHEAAAVWIADAAATPPSASSLTRLGTVGEASVWVASAPDR